MAFHVLVALAERNINPDRIKQELTSRFDKSGIDEKNSRKSTDAKTTEGESD